MSLIKNERLKLTATYLNGVSIAVFAVGGLAPVFSGVYATTGLTTLHLVLSGVCFFASFGIHLGARAILKGLEP